MTNLIDVQKALEESRELDKLWITGGFKAMSEEPIDIYPNIESDVEVVITITFPNKIYYRIPLEDVSDIGVNDSITISLNDLYSDWEERIISNLGEKVSFRSILDNGSMWRVRKYLGADEKIRTVKERVLT